MGGFVESADDSEEERVVESEQSVQSVESEKAEKAVVTVVKSTLLDTGTCIDNTKSSKSNTCKGKDYGDSHISYPGVLDGSDLCYHTCTGKPFF